MAPSTDSRTQRGEHLKRMLRRAFDSRVFNYGDYNLIFAHPGTGLEPYVIGYRRQPLELVLYPVDLETFDPRAAAEGKTAPTLTTFSLSNLATASDSGSGYALRSVTGESASFDVATDPTVTATAIGVGKEATIEQHDDAEDFYEFMSALMDALDELYTEPQEPHQDNDF